MIRIMGYGCSSSAGPRTSDFWNGLQKGTDHSSPFLAIRACKWAEPAQIPSIRDFLVSRCLEAWILALQMASGPVERNGLGVILASTKGCIDDFIWAPSSEETTRDPLQRDSLTPVLEGFLKQAEIETENRICVSNACASTLSAVFLASHWLRNGRCKQVLILAADRIGPFVAQGFQSLQALTQDRARPFSKDRSGLVLGDAAAALLLSRNQGEWAIDGIGLDTEGYAVTRPSFSGESLQRACLKIDSLLENPPDLVIAHGTATHTNDQTEDRVFSKFFPISTRPVPITGTKGSIGHTLAASGAMDLIAACEVLRTQKAFRITNTTDLDPTFGANYLGAGTHLSDPFLARQVLVTSLGFGGVHCATRVRKS